MADKPVENGIMERPSRVLVSLEDFTSLRGDELLQDLYLVVLGFNLNMEKVSKGVSNRYQNCHCETNIDNSSVQKRIPPVPSDVFEIELDNKSYCNDFGYFRRKFYKHKASDFFFAWRSPTHKVQKGRIHVFHDGYPLFYEKPKRQALIYLGVFEIPNKNITGANLNRNIVTDKIKINYKLKDAVKAYQHIHYDISQIYNNDRNRVVWSETREDRISDNFKTVKKHFSLLIKELEKNLLEHEHEIRFTNVFTFKENDEWLEGGHQDWGDHRMAMTINVQVSQ